MPSGRSGPPFGRDADAGFHVRARRRPRRGIGGAARTARPARRGGLAGGATPAAGWSVLDQVTHLAWFDEAAVRSAVSPEAFAAEQADPDPDGVAAAHRDLSGAAVLAWFDDARSRLLAVFRGLDPSLRVPWYGPPMSAASALTARIMETWAHGQDVADTLGVDTGADGPAAARRAHRDRCTGVQLRGERAGGPRRRRSGWSSSRPTAPRGPGGPRTRPTGSSRPRWTSAWSSRNAATSRTRRCG